MPQKLEKLLLVEDDPHIAEIAVLTLEQLGNFQVLHCENGLHALESIEAFAPQLLLMDVMMPGMDGPETYVHLRKIPGYENTPVIFMTAKAQTHEQESYLKLGAIGVIVKPFDPMTLCPEIERMWGAT